MTERDKFRNIGRDMLIFEKGGTLSTPEIKDALAATECVLEYLKGRGPRWDLAISPLLRDVERLQNILDARRVA